MTERGQFLASESFPTVGDWWRASIEVASMVDTDEELQTAKAAIERGTSESLEEGVGILSFWFVEHKLVPEGVSPQTYAQEFIRWSLEPPATESL